MKTLIFALLTVAALLDVRAAEDEQGLSASERGKSQAAADLREDIWGIKVRGDEKGSELAKYKTLEGSYALEVWPVGEDVPGRNEFIEGYNFEIRKALEKRYGYDVFAQVERQLADEARWYGEGVAEARKDVKEGKLRLIEYGLPADWMPEYWTIVANRYGVEVEGLGYMCSSEELQRAEGHNSIVREYLRLKHGKDVLKEEMEPFLKKEEERPSDLYRRGVADARKDVAQGYLKTYMDTKTPKWAPLFAENVRSAGVEVVDPDEGEKKFGDLEYCWGYVSISDELIQTKLGKYFFERTKHRAQKVVEKEERVRRDAEKGSESPK